MERSTPVPWDYGKNVGCWVDGHWGQYGIAYLITIAMGWGWANQEAADLARKHLASMGTSTSEDLTSDEFQALVDLADSAEAWLNTHVAPEGYSFGWYDCEFFLWSDETWQEDD